MSAAAPSPRVPAEIAQRYRGWRWDVVWRYESATITYRVTVPGETHFVKLTVPGWHPSVADEAARTTWAAGHLPVAELLDTGSNGVDWLITRGLPGVDAAHASLRVDREGLVRTVGRALRAFHDAPVEACPFDFRLDTALALARRRLAEGRIVTERDFHDEFAHLSPVEAVERLQGTRPATESPVVCHGDCCLPNVLVSQGEVTGFIDLGELGVADRWWDLAVATWSVTWNLGPGLEQLFLEAYGVAPDPERIGYYRLLYDVVS